MASDEHIVRELLAALDAGDIDTAMGFLSDDVVLRFGNATPATGSAAIAETAAAMANVVASMSHTMLAIWTTHQPDPAVICEMAVTYLRHGSELTLPCVSVFRLRDGLVADYRIYMDISPVFVMQTA